MRFRHRSEKKDREKRASFLPKTACIMFAFTGFLFLFCYLTEADLARDGNIVWTVPYTLKILTVSLCGGLLAGAAGRYALYRRSVKGRIFPTELSLKSVFPSRTGLLSSFRPLQRLCGKASSGQLFAGSFFLMVLAWLPGYLAYYPGICAYDSYIQTIQAVSGNYIDHHPIAHTLLITGAMKLGSLMGSVTAGIGLYTLLQLLFLSASFACGIVFVKRRGFGPAGILAVQLLCMLYPFHWYMSISVTKDIIFTAFFLLLLLSLTELLIEPGRRTAVGFFLSTVGMILFRNNGQYAFLVLLVFLALAAVFGTDCRRWRKLFLLAFAGFITGVLSLHILFAATGAQQGDKREMLSMPIQQLARTMLYHGGIGELPEDDNTMTEEDKALINDFLQDECYREYDPHISDPVKRHTNTSVVRYRTGEFISSYLSLLTAYPGDFLNAALALNAGFLSPADTSHAYINVSEERKGLSYVQTRWEEGTLNENGIYKASRWEGLYTCLERWADQNVYLDLPVLKYLFVPGIWLWLYLLLAAFLLYHGKARLCLPLSLILGYYITLFLGPTVQLRYIYPVMAAWPFLMLICGRTAMYDTAAADTRS